MKKLYKSKANRKVCGVCGGISDYIGVDATVIRLIFALFCLLCGTGLLIYIAAAIIMPEKPDYVEAGL